MKALTKGFIAAAVGILIHLPLHESLHALASELLGFQVGGFFIAADLSWNVMFAHPIAVTPTTAYPLAIICLIPYIFGLVFALMIAITRKVWLTPIALFGLLANVMPVSQTTDYAKAILIIPEGGAAVAFLQLASGGILAVFLTIYLASFIRFKCSPKPTIS